MTRRAHRPPQVIVERSFPLIDLERSSDGRTVTAYAATFGDEYEVRDQFGHYWESINRAAFNRTLGRGLNHVQVLFNHGRTIEGASSSRFSMPLGTPIEVKPDTRGLLTVTRYAKTPLADEVLELIGDGAIRAQSFRGAIVHTAPARPGREGLQTLERLELGLREYGPCPFAVNTGAEVLSLRSDLLTVAPEDLTDEERAELRALLDSVNGPSPDPADLGPSGEPAEEEDPQQQPAEEAPAAGSSLHVHEIAQAQRRRRLGLTTLKES